MFFLRPPVILVSDIYFSAVYGRKYENIGRIDASFKIFRQIKIVRVMEDTSSLSITEAIQKSSRRPAAVFFPYAYIEAAGLYAKVLAEDNNSATKTFVFSDGNNQDNNDFPFYYVKSRTEVDYYRAGVCAASLASETPPALESALAGGGGSPPNTPPQTNDPQAAGGSPESAPAQTDNAIAQTDKPPDTAAVKELPEPKSNKTPSPIMGKIKRNVFFIYDKEPSIPEKTAFYEGLKYGGFSENVDFTNSNADKDWRTAVSVVVAGSAKTFFQSAQPAPIVLFSWYNNINYIPESVKILVNDSPYYLIPKALSLADSEGQKIIIIPSDFRVLEERIGNKRTKKELLDAVLLKAFILR